MDREVVVTTIALPPSLHADIKAIAVENHRSMNMQMVHWLEFCVDRHQARKVPWWGTSYVESGWEGEEEEE